MATEGLAHQLFAHERRRAQRDEVFAICAMGLGGPARFDAELVDIAPNGCMVRTAAITGEGQAVQIALPGLGEMIAQVVWAMGSRIGMQFEQPLSPRDYATMMAAIEA